MSINLAASFSIFWGSSCNVLGVSRHYFFLSQLYFALLIYSQKQVELAKKDWELEHLQAKKEAEERKNAAEEDDMFFTYARDESYDQVPSPKTSSTKAAMNKLKMRIAKVISNGDNQPSDNRLSYEVIDVEDAQNANGEEDIDVVMDGQNQTSIDGNYQTSPIELEPKRRTRKVDHQQSETGHSRETRLIGSEGRSGRSSRQSSRSSSRTSSRSSSRNRAHRSCNASPAHTPMYARSTSRS